MGILNKLIGQRGDAGRGSQIRLINNRANGPAISYNRRTLFKQFNYQFQCLELKSVAS